MKKATFSLVLIFGVLLSCAPQNNTLPNIILISADDLGWSDLGCYGSEVQTPNIDELAQQGMRFTQFHNTSKCFPSRACLITGVYAQDCGYSQTHKNPLTRAVTLGEVLRTKGYTTIWCGKHHGKDNPYDRGFDHYFGLKDGACNYFNPGLQRQGEPVPARKTDKREWCIDGEFFKPYTPPQKDYYNTDYFTHYALNWLDEAAEKENPFFLYLAFTAPHDPLMAWPEDIAKYESIYEQGYENIRKQRYAKQKAIGLIDERYRLSEPTFTPWQELSESSQKEQARKMQVYAAMIDRMDQNIGRVLEKLKALDKIDNTLIMFVSDNGASAEVVNLKDDDDTAEIGTMARWVSLGPDWANVSNTPFRFYKNYSYEGGINTPFIAWWPNKIKANSFSEYPGHFIDMMATIVDITQAEYPSQFNGEQITPMKGKSLLPAFLGKQTERDTPLYWSWRHGKAMRRDNWKIVKHATDTWDLYNLQNDPTELNNLANEHPARVALLDSLYAEWIKPYQADSK